MWHCIGTYVHITLTFLTVLSTEKRNASSNYGTLTFPLQDSLEKYNNTNTNIDVVRNSIQIPESLIQQRAKHYGMSVYQTAVAT